jgi:hypothetical protein
LPAIVSRFAGSLLSSAITSPLSPLTGVVSV